MHGPSSLKSARIAIYARFSSDRQKETSIDDQVRRCREYIAQAGGDPDHALVFPDYAISGASLDRPGFESLMAAMESQRVDVIVTEDISRISRDFADSAHVFKRLQYAQVPLIGIADGINTSTRDAKLSFTLKSLVADIYLDDLRDKTLRGLEGRASAGYATGNTPYGFRSKPETDPYGQVRGHVIEIVPEQAEIMVRIFTMCRDGGSQSGIARTLNKEGIPSPRTGTRHKRSEWGASTIRAMLYNERYIGIWKFKETQWVKVPGSNKRRPRARDESEVMRFEWPHLRIIDAQLWDEVQTRLRATHRKYTRDNSGRPKGRARGNASSPYLFSSLLYCSMCEAPMTIIGGASAAYYRCSTYRKKGTCENKLSIREEVARTGLLSHLRAMLLNREILGYVRQQAAKVLGQLAHGQEDEIRERRQRLERVEARIQGLIGFIADGDRSEYVVSALRDLEAQAKDERARIAALQAQSHTPIRLPSLDEITGAALDLNARLQEDVAAGREQLRKLFRDGRIIMTPRATEYHARSQIFPLAILAKSQPKKQQRDFSNEIALFASCSGDPLSRLCHIPPIRIQETLSYQ